MKVSFSVLLLAACLMITLASDTPNSNMGYNGGGGFNGMNSNMGFNGGNGYNNVNWAWMSMNRNGWNGMNSNMNGFNNGFAGRPDNSRYGR